MKNLEQSRNRYAPCPQCGANDAELVKFTWWGGVLGPKLLTQVKCPHCRRSYNGKTGAHNSRNIVIYSVVAAVIAFGVMFFVFFVAFFGIYFFK